MDWSGNDDDENALQRGFQGEGSAGGDQGDLMLAARRQARCPPQMIATWKRQAIGGMADIFSGAGGVAKDTGEREVEKLHASIGQRSLSGSRRHER